MDDPDDSHTLVYRYLTRQISVTPEELVASYMIGNRTNFTRYLRERDQRKSK